MDSLIAASARALAGGDALGVLKRIALREDPPALALRGIAMAQLGDLARARELLQQASRGFGPREPLARARCSVAEAEVALALRDLDQPPRTLAAAIDTLQAHGDSANTAHGRVIALRRLLLLGRLGEARAALAQLDGQALPAPLAAIACLAAAELALRAARTAPAREALAQAQAQGVAHLELPIEPPFQAFLQALAPAFAGKPADVTEENLQSRCRGVMLMALSNKSGRMLLSTGNKSEMAVGYATIYGDMCGGYAPLKDVYKTWVYRLARWRNACAAVIPEEVITRPPSAELRENQTDQDSLPPYDVLDAILDRFIEGEQSQAEIVAAGFDEATVRRVARLVLANEYKRRQSAPGPKVSTRAFGRDRRYPITSGWR